MVPAAYFILFVVMMLVGIAVSVYCFRWALREFRQGSISWGRAAWFMLVLAFVWAAIAAGLVTGRLPRSPRDIREDGIVIRH